VVTRGGEGAVVVTADAVAEIPPVEVEVVDTIGAGDAFGGALLTGLAGGPVEPARLRAAAELAVRVAALTCARAGASPPAAPEVGLHRPASSG
jgi:sugar/nucleoside kinase (ribokinase family)